MNPQCRGLVLKIHTCHSLRVLFRLETHIIIHLCNCIGTNFILGLKIIEKRVSLDLILRLNNIEYIINKGHLGGIFVSPFWFLNFRSTHWTVVQFWLKSLIENKVYILINIWDINGQSLPLFYLLSHSASLVLWNSKVLCMSPKLGPNCSIKRFSSIQTFYQCSKKLIIFIMHDKKIS